MNAYVNYLIEANLALLITLLFHEVVLKTETHFGFRRTFLLVGILASLLFPLIRIQTTSTVLPSIGKIMPTYFLPELVIGDNQVAASSSPVNYWIIVKWIYIAISLFLLIHLLVKLGRIIAYLRTSSSNVHEGKFRIIESSSDLPTFSFFRYIFIGNTAAFTPEERQQIINHEITHATKLHSIDILIAEFLKVIFWFNPGVYYFKSLFTSIHEFQADQLAVDNRDVNQYCNLLARVALQSADYPIANHFNNSLTLKRIAMMKTAKTKLSRWKVATIVPLLVGLFVFIACQDQVISEITKNGKTITQSSDLPPEVVADMNAYKEKNAIKEDKGKFTYVVGDADEIRKLGASNYSGQVLINTYPQKDGTIGVLMHDVGQYANQLTQQSKAGDEIFTIVEEPASPVGGMPEFFKYVGAEIKYPLTARQNNINGKVFIEFVVNEDGHISDVAAVKGIGGGCDEEAIRVVSNSPKWNAARQRGKTVKQRMVLPIMFNFDNQKTAFIALDELQEVASDFVVDVSYKKIGSKSELSGTVTDASGKPIDGMNIIIRNTTTGTVTMQGGRFNLQSEITTGELVFSFIGYKTKSVSF